MCLGVNKINTNIHKLDKYKHQTIKNLKPQKLVHSAKVQNKSQEKQYLYSTR
jgi:hypothetical protein